MGEESAESEEFVPHHCIRIPPADRTTLRDVVGALLGRPDENRDGRPRRTGATLTELVEKNAASRARAAALSSHDTALSSE